jgi:hypothetical protein
MNNNGQNQKPYTQLKKLIKMKTLTKQPKPHNFFVAIFEEKQEERAKE